MYLRRSLLLYIFSSVFLFIGGFWLLSSFTEGETRRPKWANLFGSEVDYQWPAPLPEDDTLRKESPNPIPDLSSNPSFEDIGVSSPLLRARLKRLLTLPVLSHAQSVSTNGKGCPRDVADRQVNQDQLKDQRQWWTEIDEDEIRTRRAAIVSYLENLDKQTIALVGDDAKLEGRGIVMTAGNRVWYYLAISVRIFPNSTYIIFIVEHCSECFGHFKNTKAKLRIEIACSSIFIPWRNKSRIC